MDNQQNINEISIGSIDNKLDDSKKTLLKKIKNNETIDASELVELSLEDLLRTDETEKTYLYYFLESDQAYLLPNNIKKEIYNDKELLISLIKNKQLLAYYDLENEDIWFERFNGDQCLLDLAFSFYAIPKGFSVGFKKRYEIIDYYKKYDKQFLISAPLAELMFTENNGEFIIDKYKDDKNLFESAISKASAKVLLNYCNKKGDYSILKNAKEIVLLSKIDGNKTVLEYLLENNIVPEANNFIKDKAFNIFVNNNRFDLLYKFSFKFLLLPYKNDKTYLDIMIELQKKGLDMHFDIFSKTYYTGSAEEYAKFLTILAKNDFVGFIPNVSIPMLNHKKLNDKRTVLECLIENERELLINKILPKCDDKHDEGIIFTLRSYGIDDIHLKLKTKEVQFSDEYIEAYNSHFLVPIQTDDEDLLIELETLFKQDGLSDESAIKWLIASYRYLISIGNPYAKEELIHLIEIKKIKRESFAYKKIRDGAYFSKTEGVCIDNYIISTIHHETSHALHYHLADYTMPDNYSEIVKRIRDNPDTIGKIIEYSQRFAEIKKQLHDSVSSSEISEYYDRKYEGEQVIELSNFLRSAKEERKDRYIDSFPEEVLDTILSSTYSVDEYIEQRKQIEISEVADAKYRIEYDAFAAVGDIIDAVYGGRYRNGILMDKDGNFIPHAYGHGMSYYTNDSKGFVEMIANYGSIIKSKNGPQVLEYLRYILGNELVDMLANYYKKSIIDSTKYTQDNTEERNDSYGK